MDENLADKLFEAATYLAYMGIADPTNETILSLFGWLVYECSESGRNVH